MFVFSYSCGLEKPVPEWTRKDPVQWVICWGRPFPKMIWINRFGFQWLTISEETKLLTNFTRSTCSPTPRSCSVRSSLTWTRYFFANLLNFGQAHDSFHSRPISSARWFSSSNRHWEFASSWPCSSWQSASFAASSDVSAVKFCSYATPAQSPSNRLLIFAINQSPLEETDFRAYTVVHLAGWLLRTFRFPKTLTIPIFAKRKLKLEVSEPRCIFILSDLLVFITLTIFQGWRAHKAHTFDTLY